MLAYDYLSSYPKGAIPVRALIPTFAYFSPETLLPATSIVATIAGIVMMLGRGALRLLRRSRSQGLRQVGRIAATSEPHIHAYEDSRTRAKGH
jgi:hypothetical protein